VRGALPIVGGADAIATSAAGAAGRTIDLNRTSALLFAALACATVAGSAGAAPAVEVINPPPTAKDWADLAKLPDWSGVWSPDIVEQTKQVDTDVPPWKPGPGRQAARMLADEKAGHPRSFFSDCLPLGMPSFMLVVHNPIEFLFTPGRVTMLGDSDGGRLRRIYTDGRPHPDDPDPTFHGHSIGHWEGATLVVDTVGILPQAWLAVNEAAGVPLNGDAHIVEHIHLVDADTLHDDLEITAPAILTKPWKTTRSFYRERERKYDIVEGVCLQGNFVEGKDADGNSVFVPVETKDGNVVPGARKN
jgi:hypothetical protein